MTVPIRRASMRFRTVTQAVLLALLVLAVPQLARAELKLAVLKVKGMVCSS
jgi:hypothetical protein